MPALHVITHKDELDPDRIAGKVAVVFDVLFATSIVTALAHGATAVIPAVDAHAARREAQRQPDQRYLLAGEKNAELIGGFAPFAPLALARHPLAGQRVIYSTTNGTVALQLCRQAAHVFAAALLNGQATAGHLCDQHGRRDILLVCAGSIGRFNLEDFLGAGHLIQALTNHRGDRWRLTDSALAARALYRNADVPELLRQCRVGRMVAEMGLAEEVTYSAQADTLDIVCELHEHGIVAVTR
jgi:2-phosphosulfolactate phosphatase